MGLAAGLAVDAARPVALSFLKVETVCKDKTVSRFIGLATIKGTMLTTIIPGVVAYDDDESVVTAIAAACAKVTSGTPNIRIGLVGPSGEIYRLVIAHGPDQVAQVLDVLTERRFQWVPPYAGMNIVLDRHY